MLLLLYLNHNFVTWTSLGFVINTEINLFSVNYWKLNGMRCKGKPIMFNYISSFCNYMYLNSQLYTEGLNAKNIN